MTVLRIGFQLLQHGIRELCVGDLQNGRACAILRCNTIPGGIRPPQLQVNLVFQHEGMGLPFCLNQQSLAFAGRRLGFGLPQLNICRALKHLYQSVLAVLADTDNALFNRNQGFLCLNLEQFTIGQGFFHGHQYAAIFQVDSCFTALLCAGSLQLYLRIRFQMDVLIAVCTQCKRAVRPGTHAIGAAQHLAIGDILGGLSLDKLCTADILRLDDS